MTRRKAVEKLKDKSCKMPVELRNYLIDLLEGKNIEKYKVAADILTDHKEWGWSGKTEQAIDVAIECMQICENIVHCKDCKYFEKNEKTFKLTQNETAGICGLVKWFIGEEGYCLYGERNTSNTYK